MLALLLAATLLTPGRYAVGYRAEEVQDAGRAVYVQVWYPATPAKGAAAMPYGDYFRDVPAPLKQRSLSVHEYAARVYEGDTAKLFASPSKAHRDVAPAAGRFPLIVYGGGAGNSIDENALLGEYLASNGFVFVAVPATGASTVEIPLDAAGLETEARDMELAASWGRKLPSVATDGWIAGGFSFGGAAAIVVASRQKDVKAVFLLDSSVTAKQYAPLVASSPSFDPEQLTAPVLDLHREDEKTVTYDVLDRLIYAERVSLDVEGPRHIDFNAYPLLYAHGSERGQGYEWIAATVHAFLSGTFTFRGSDAYPATGRRRTALPAPPTAAELEHLARYDIAAAARRYEELRKIDPRPSVIAPESIDRIGHALLKNGDAAAAREVFLWNVRNDLKNAGWLDSLGDALVKTGERDCARAVRELKARGRASTPCKYLEGMETR